MTSGTLATISKIGLKLLDVIERASGWAIFVDRPERIARKTLIEEIQHRSDLNSLEKQAMISNVKRIMREYNNQRFIVEEAISKLEETAKPEDVDEDWIVQFMDKTRLVSDEEVQHIWAKLLAEECNDPNSVPKSLLFTLERMSKEDAEAFVNICRLSVSIDNDFFPVIVSDKYENDYYGKYDINYEVLLQLDKLGLLENSIGKTGNFHTVSDNMLNDSQTKLSYFNHNYYVSGDVDSIPVGVVLLTKDGQALCKAISCDEAQGFWDEMILPWIEEINMGNEK